MGVVITVKAINPAHRKRIGEEYTRKEVVGIAKKDDMIDVENRYVFQNGKKCNQYHTQEGQEGSIE